MSSRDGRRSRPIAALGRVSRVPRMKIAKARRLSQLRTQFHEYRELANDQGVTTRLDWSDRILCADDSTTSTSYDRHYLLHPAWAARIVQQLAPAQHIDISSTLNFCSMVSAFVPCRFYDFRPVELGLSNLEMGSADLTGLFFADNSLESVSCMHVVEHIGLGRYGDPLDATGDKKAMSELERVVAPGGSLLIVVPVGRPRVCFNAHRIYSHEQIVSQFSHLELEEFTVIRDWPSEEIWVRNANAEAVAESDYDCGCFWFRKP